MKSAKNSDINKICLDTKKFNILLSMTNYFLSNIEEDDYYLFYLANSFLEKDIDDMEEDEYNDCMEDMVKSLLQIKEILIRSRKNFNDKMIL